MTLHAPRAFSLQGLRFFYLFLHQHHAPFFGFFFRAAISASMTPGFSGSESIDVADPDLRHIEVSGESSDDEVQVITLIDRHVE